MRAYVCPPCSSYPSRHKGPSQAEIQLALGEKEDIHGSLEGSVEWLSEGLMLEKVQ
jgi:hypothetical protein